MESTHIYVLIPVFINWSVESCIIGTWEKKVGDTVKVGDTLYSIAKKNNISVDLLKEYMRDLTHEECHAILLDISLKLIDTVLVGKGTTDASLVDVRHVLREAILRKASRIILCHNHPSGNLTPSRQDDQLTQRLKVAAENLQIPLIDHIIISSEGYYSYSEEGKI